MRLAPSPLADLSSRLMRRRSLVALFSLLLAVPAAAQAQNPFLGTWTVIATAPGPWYVANHSGPSPDNPSLRNARVEIQPNRLTAPHPLACANPHYAVFTVPPEGLFEGGLHDPSRGRTNAAALAAGLGFPPGDAPTLETRCSALRFHLAGTDRMLFAMDNVIYTLARVPSR